MGGFWYMIISPGKEEYAIIFSNAHPMLKKLSRYLSRTHTS